MYAFDRTKFLTLVLGGLVSAISMALVSCGSGPQAVGGTAEATFVAVTQMVERPALNAVRDGIKDELGAAGYQEGKTLRWEWQSAKGSPRAAAHIAKKYAIARPNVIVAIAPHSAQTVAKITKNTPVIFSAVADPIGEKLIKSIKKPGGNISGISDASPIQRQLALIQEILPEIKTIGIIYGASDSNTSSTVERIDNDASKLNVTIAAVMVLTANDVVEAARNLVGTVDAIYIPTDQTVNSALESVIQVGRDNQLPIFAGDTNAARRGAIATLSFDYYNVGRQTGAMVIRVLRGSRPSDLAVEFIQDLQLSINSEAARSMGVTLPESVLSRADKIWEDTAL